MLRRILSAANAIFFGHIIVRLGSVVLVPLFLKYWSASLYGEYVALFAAVSYLSGLDIGMQQAAINRLTQAYARGDLQEYRRVQHTAIAFYVALATGATLLVASIAWVLPVSHWIGLKLTPPTTTALVIMLLAIYVMWSMPMRFMAATYQTMGNMARSQWIANIQQILVVILAAIVLILGKGMLSVALVQVLVVGVVVGFVLLDLRRRLPVFRPGLSQAKFSVLKDLAHPSLLFALLLAGNLIAFQGSTLIVSATLGGLAVAVLSVSRTIIDMIRQGLYSITLALCPDFARLEALGELEKLRKVHRMAIAATGVFTLALSASVWYEGPRLIALWTGGRIEPDAMLLRLLLVLLALQTPWAASSTVATATNRHRAQAIGYFFAAIVGIATAAMLVPWLGTWAVPVGLILGEAVGCYHFVIKATCHIIGEKYSTFALRFWLGFAVVTTAVLTTGWLIHNLLPGPLLLRWAVMGLCTLTIATICAWLVWLTPEDRALLSPKLRPVLRFSGASA